MACKINRVPSLQRNFLNPSLNYRELALFDVVVVLRLANLHAILQDVEQQHLRSFLGVGQQPHSLLERRHLELELVVLYYGHRHLEQVNLALEEEVVPNPGQELVLGEAAAEQRQEPVHHEQLGADFQCLEVGCYERQVLVYQVIEEFDSEVYFGQVALEEGQEVVAVHHIRKSYEGIVLVKVSGEDLCELEEISHQADVRTDDSQQLYQLNGFHRIGHFVNGRDLLLPADVHLI